VTIRVLIADDQAMIRGGLKLILEDQPDITVIADPSLRSLSDHEIEVVREIARGRTKLEIGAELFISLSTVKGHVSTIQTKLGLRNRTEIAVWAWENQIAGA
jgi:DNA-binding NarL/FixJ family response regulator